MRDGRYGLPQLLLVYVWVSRFKFNQNIADFFYKFLVSGRSGAIKSNELDLEYDLHSHVGRGV